jgi:peptidoglycan/LPS O-acetylase OafA/YrhL
VPGGALRLRAVDAAGVGELLYTGPNVMLGYAQRREDLGLGRTVHELATGDLARQGPDGLFEVVGRRSRFAKAFGLRVDLLGVEDALAAQGLATWATGVGDALVVLVERPAAALAAREAAAAAAGLPLRAVRVVLVDELPRTARGKVDGARSLALATAAVEAPAVTAVAAPGDSVAALFAEVLGRDDVTGDSTFTGLGGDSLSYVEVSLRLEDALGQLPPEWHVTPVRQLQARQDAGAPRSSARLDSTVLLRAVGILLVVASHSHLLGLKGGAHALIAVAGYNFARFRLTPAPRRERLLGMWRGVRRIAVPSVLLIAATAVTTAQVGLIQVALVNSVLGPDVLGPGWRYWFVEALVQLLAIVAVLLAVPALDRAERRWPFWFPLALVGVGLLTRSVVLTVGSGPDRTQSAASLLWLFALGWCAARSRSAAERRWLTLIAAALVVWFFVDQVQGLVVLAALVLLFWAPSVALARWLVPVRPALGLLAAASLYVYLTHWPVLALLEGRPLLSTVACLAVGLLTHGVVVRVGARLRAARAAGQQALAARRDRSGGEARSNARPGVVVRRRQLVGSGGAGSAG